MEAFSPVSIDAKDFICRERRKREGEDKKQSPNHNYADVWNRDFVGLDRSAVTHLLQPKVPNLRVDLTVCVFDYRIFAARQFFRRPDLVQSLTNLAAEVCGLTGRRR